MTTFTHGNLKYEIQKGDATTDTQIDIFLKDGTPTHYGIQVSGSTYIPTLDHYDDDGNFDGVTHFEPCNSIEDALRAIAQKINES